MMATIPLPQPSTGGRLEPPMVYVPPAWEYMEIERSVSADQLPTAADLNTLGADGWELAGVVQAGDAAHFYFKRLAE
jgi:hypothetical protein